MSVLFSFLSSSHISDLAFLETYATKQTKDKGIQLKNQVKNIETDTNSGFTGHSAEMSRFGGMVMCMEKVVYGII